MRYETVVEGYFINRPNRFIAMVEIDGREEVCHVKNTGRCRELLPKGAKVYLEKSSNPNRKTAYDLIAVEKNGMMINMDSQAPNKVVYEWLKKQDYDYIKPEYKIGSSRLDFYMEKDGKKTFMEVKGVTLEEAGVARFPDAPTERGVRHIEELIELVNQGHEACILFVLQMKPMHHLEPNDATHRAFGDALRKAHEAGVKILAYDCLVTKDTMVLDEPVPVKLDIGD